jgi:hypothetical protein
LLGPMIWHNRSQLVLFSHSILIKYNEHREGTAMKKDVTKNNWNLDIPFLWNPSSDLHVSTCLFKIWNPHIYTMCCVFRKLLGRSPIYCSY